MSTNSRVQALHQLQSILELVHDYNKDPDGYAAQRIHEDPLCVEYRAADWSLEAGPRKPDEYRVLLCTGGPAVAIVGSLLDDGSPHRSLSPGPPGLGGAVARTVPRRRLRRDPRRPARRPERRHQGEGGLPGHPRSDLHRPPRLRRLTGASPTTARHPDAPFLFPPRF